jgi:hypothetical protein
MRTLAELIPMRTGACRDAVDAVSTIAAGEGDADPAGAAHVSECLRCQAEVIAYRRVLRVMVEMRDDPVALPFAELGAAAGSGSIWAVRAAYVGGITAGAAGMFVWLSRRRPLVRAG